MNVQEAVGNDQFLLLTNLTQEVYYPSVYPDVDLQYIIFTTGIKENYVFKNKNAQKEFTITYRANGLTAIQYDKKQST